MKHPYLAKLRFLLLLLTSLGFTPLMAQAQTGSVSGRVTDDKKDGVPGATVVVDGSTLGSSSNVDGTYNIAGVPAGSHTLVISYVGYNTVRQAVVVVAGQNTVADAALSENTTQLAEAVVIGYGTQRKQDVTGAVTTVDARQFVAGQITNPEQLIQGKVAGVSITTGGGAPGAAATVRIRGNSSLNANSDPLYVIDGVPVDKDGISGASNPLSLINPNDIETFTVLKDASATAIYGNRASGGVILITTKRGAVGEATRVSFNSQTSLATVAKRYDVMSATEFRAAINSAESGASASQRATLGTADTNWQDQVFRNAMSYDNNLSVSGAAGKVPYRLSYGNLYQEGIVVTNKLVRDALSLNLTPRLFDNHLKVDINAKGTSVDNRFIDNGQITGAALYDPTQPVTSSDPRFVRFGGYYQFLQPDGKPRGLAPGNPVASLLNTRNVSNVKRLITNIQLDYKVHGVEGLRANLNLATDIARGRGTTTNAPTDFGTFNPDAINIPGRNGKLTQFSQDKDMRLLEAYLAYSKQLNESSRFDVQGGYAYQSFENQGPNFLDRRFNGVTKFNPTDTLLVPAYYNKYVLISFFGRATLNIKDRYLLTATWRNDRTSRFAPGRNSGQFPALGVAWRIKSESFLANNNTITDLKLRAGYGRTGQQDIGGQYDYLPRYVIGNSAAQYIFNNNNLGITARPSGYNDKLTWETTNTYNAGLDIGLFDNRVTATIDVYQRTASDLLASVFLPAGANLTNKLNDNIGSLRNRGIEAAVNLGLVRSENLTWDVNVNGAYNRNQITDLGTQQPNFSGYLVGGISGGTGTTVQVQRVGEAPNAFLVSRQVYDANGRPIQGLYASTTQTDGTTSSVYTYKQPAPLVTLGLSSNVAYKQLSLAFVLRSNIGNYVYNNGAANFGSYANAQGSTGFLNNLPPSVTNTGYSTPQYLSDYYVENASFLRCENITLGYNVGKVLGGSGTLRLTGNVQNVFVVTKYTGLDPEIFGGIDNNFYPRARTYTFGLALGF